MNFKKVFYISFLFVGFVFGQSNTNINDKFNLKFKAGLLFPSDNYYLFMNVDANRIPRSLRYIPFKHGYSIGVGLEVLELIKTSNSNISAEIETNYGYTTTKEELKLSFNESQMSYQQLTTLIWFKIISSGTINPYFRIGIGVNQKWIEESHSHYTDWDSKFYQLLFCLGISSGIEYKISQSLTMQFFVDALYSPGGEKETLEKQIYYDFGKESGSILTGLGISYSF